MGRRGAKEPSPDWGTGYFDPDPAAAARTVLINSLAVMPRTRRQLADLLVKKEIPDDAAVAALDRFEELGYIDDADFAQRWVRSRAESKGLTRRVLKMELRQRGVSDDDMELALEQIDSDDERCAAVEFATRKVRSMSGLDDEKKKRRLASALMRRGHSPGVALAVADEVIADAVS